MPDEVHEAFRKWANGLTDEDVERMGEEMGKGAAQIVGFAQVLSKIKQAHDTKLSHVVLTANEIDFLMRGLRLLTTRKKEQ